MPKAACECSPGAVDRQSSVESGDVGGRDQLNEMLAGSSPRFCSPPPRRKLVNGNSELIGRQEVPNVLHGDGRVKHAEPAPEHGRIALIETPGESTAD